eukprot:1096437-Pyramimonas_sp.AAC.1
MEESSYGSTTGRGRHGLLVLGNRVSAGFRARLFRFLDVIRCYILVAVCWLWLWARLAPFAPRAWAFAGDCASVRS